MEDLQYQNYRASVHYCSDSNVYYSKISGITDLISFEGSTIEELKQAFKDAVEDYQEICREIGK